MVTVLNLASNEEYTYSDMSPLDALINTAILNDLSSDFLDNPLTREKYRKKIIVGRYSASIGNFGVLLEKA